MATNNRYFVAALILAVFCFVPNTQADYHLPLSAYDSLEFSRMSRLEDEFLRLSQKFSTIESRLEGRKEEKEEKILIHTSKRSEIDELRVIVATIQSNQENIQNEMGQLNGRVTLLETISKESTTNQHQIVRRQSSSNTKNSLTSLNNTKTSSTKTSSTPCPAKLACYFDTTQKNSDHETSASTAHWAHLVNDLGKCFTVHADDSLNDRIMLQAGCNPREIGQTWSWNEVSLGSGDKHLCNGYGKCASVRGINLPTPEIFQWNRLDEKSQKFDFLDSPARPGFYLIKINSGKCISVPEDKHRNFAKIRASHCNASESGQNWKWNPLK